MNLPASALPLWLLLGGAALAGPGQAEEASSRGVVRIRERAVLELHDPLAGRTAQARARDASETLTHVLDLPGPDAVHLEPAEQGVTLLVGATPVLELGPADARAAGAS